MRIVAVSDTHTRHKQVEVPDGDVFIHAGDFTRRGDLHEVVAFDKWVAKLPHKHKIVIAGNHDWCLQLDPENARAAITSAIYLEDSGVELDGVKFWGSPWQPWFLDWAFNLQRGAPLAEKWALVPVGTEVLITHGPPYGYGDVVSRDGSHVGCEALIERIRELRPRVHICGHIHEGSGVVRDGHTVFVNASVLDEGYGVAFPARVIDL